MPATAILLPLAESFGLGALGVTAGGVGAATLGAAGIEASTLVASTVGGAIIGAGTSAVNAAIQGGDIGKAALGGAVGGGVGTAVGGELAKTLGAGPAGGPGMSAVPPSLLGSPTAASTAIGAVSQGAGTLAGSLATGAPLDRALQQALRGAEVGGIGGLASGLAKYQFDATPRTAQDVGQTASALAGAVLPTASGAQPSYPTYQAPPTPSLSMQGPAPSATLGQSLSIAPTLGYSPGLTVFGSGGEGDQPKKPVWNVASLRNVGSAEA